MTIEKSKEDLKRDKGIRILTMIDHAYDQLEQLEKDVEEWSAPDADLSPETLMKHSMHQNETCTTLQSLVNFLQNRRHKA
jgi:hypothetical protein